MVIITQPFGDMSVFLQVKCCSGGSFGQRYPLYLDHLKSKFLSIWPTPITTPLSLSEDGGISGPGEKLRHFWPDMPDSVTNTVYRSYCTVWSEFIKQSCV